MKKLNLFFCALLSANFLFSQTVSDFENLTLPADTFWDGSDLTGGFNSGNARFVNDYNTSFFSWSGFTYSNKKDDTTMGYANQYSAIPAEGWYGSPNYAVANEYGNAKILLTGNAAGKPVEGFYITNTTYTYLSIKNGDMFSKKFGGISGTDPDWFRLRVLGWSNGALKAQAVDFYLADYRSVDSTQDYAVKDWTWVDLQPLGNVDSILFQLTSSDTGSFGMNTPAYFAMDNFTTADEANSAPTAADDVVYTTYLNDTLIAVLANDADTTGLPLTVTLLGAPLISGATAVVSNNEIHYTPATGIVAVDTLTYQVCDGGNMCASAKVIVHVTGINAVDDIAQLQLNVFPNPFSNSLTVSGLQFTSAQAKQIVVCDGTGKEVFNQTVSADNTQLSTDNWSSGIYFLKVISDGEILVRKIVKQ